MNFSPPEFKYGDWFESLIPSMSRWVTPNAESIVEVGSFEGRSTSWLLARCPRAVVTSIDHFLGGQDQQDLVDLTDLFARFAVNTRTYANRLKLLKFSSWEAWPMIPPGQTDVVFVDGSHLACDVMWDMCNGLRVLRPEGLLLADDYTWETHRKDCPKIALDMFMSLFLDRVEVLEKTRLLVLRKL